MPWGNSSPETMDASAKVAHEELKTIQENWNVEQAMAVAGFINWLDKYAGTAGYQRMLHPLFGHGKHATLK